jgi:hypothetical protein
VTTEAILEPKVFISYSWSSDDYEQWVIDLAKRLESNGVEVVIDKWDLAEGQDKYVFMEQMAMAEDIDKVLMLCDEKYQKKADERSGGVGDETQIISSKIYGDVKQGKFIPIVTERDQDGQYFLPHYLSSRIYIDLSSIDCFEDGYEQLLRSIYNVPQYQRPARGKMPSFLIEREVDHYKTSAIIRKMESLIDKQPNRLKSLSYEFTEAFMEILSEFDMEKKEDTILDDFIYEKIEQMLPLKDEYASMLKLVCDAEVLESEFIVEFFEKIYVYTEFRGSGSYYEGQFDCFKFLANELYLHTVMILLERKSYQELAEILNADYYLGNTGKPQNFCEFRFYLPTLESRNNRLSLSRLSLHADLIFNRAGEKGREIAEVDIILYYISKMQSKESWGWYPTSYIYFKEDKPIRFISKLNSKRHFEKTKDIFSVSDVIEMKDKINSIQHESGYNRGFARIPTIQKQINPDEIASKI